MHRIKLDLFFQRAGEGEREKKDFSSKQKLRILRRRAPVDSNWISPENLAIGRSLLSWFTDWFYNYTHFQKIRQQKSIMFWLEMNEANRATVPSKEQVFFLASSLPPPSSPRVAWILFFASLLVVSGIKTFIIKNVFEIKIRT